ncbi:hypothetical protein AHAS_Ahas10G0060100 [Arachis hypogaea]
MLLTGPKNYNWAQQWSEWITLWQDRQWDVLGAEIVDNFDSSDLSARVDQPQPQPSPQARPRSPSPQRQPCPPPPTHPPQTQPLSHPSEVGCIPTHDEMAIQNMPIEHPYVPSFDAPNTHHSPQLTEAMAETTWDQIIGFMQDPTARVSLDSSRSDWDRGIGHEYNSGTSAYIPRIDLNLIDSSIQETSEED